MKHTVELRLYASACARNEFYMERVRQTADALGLDYTLEKVMDEAVHAALGLEESCQMAYCPGCRALRGELSVTEPDARYIPALAADGVLLFWNVPPTDEALRAALTRYQ